MAWYAKLWVKVSVLAIAVGLVVGGTYAYYRLVQPMTGPRVTVTSLPLEFSMELDKTEYQYGENITIKFRLENIGNTTITITRASPPGWPLRYMETSYFNAYTIDDEPVPDPDPDTYYRLENEFHFGFRIAYINGTGIYDTSRGVLPYAYSFYVDPGGWIEQTIIWDYYTTDWEGHEIDFNGAFLFPGTYQLRGAFRYSLGGPPLCILETPVITFVIE